MRGVRLPTRGGRCAPWRLRRVPDGLVAPVVLRDFGQDQLAVVVLSAVHRNAPDQFAQSAARSAQRTPILVDAAASVAHPCGIGRSRRRSQQPVSRFSEVAALAFLKFRHQAAYPHRRLVRRRFFEMRAHLSPQAGGERRLRQLNVAFLVLGIERKQAFASAHAVQGVAAGRALRRPWRIPDAASAATLRGSCARRGASCFDRARMSAIRNEAGRNSGAWARARRAKRMASLALSPASSLQPISTAAWRSRHSSAGSTFIFDALSRGLQRGAPNGRPGPEGQAAS